MLAVEVSGYIIQVGCCKTTSEKMDCVYIAFLYNMLIIRIAQGHFDRWTGGAGDLLMYKML